MCHGGWELEWVRTDPQHLEVRTYGSELCAMGGKSLGIPLVGDNVMKWGEGSRSGISLASVFLACVLPTAWINTNARLKHIYLNKYTDWSRTFTTDADHPLWGSPYISCLDPMCLSFEYKPSNSKPYFIFVNELWFVFFTFFFCGFPCRTFFQLLQSVSLSLQYIC